MHTCLMSRDTYKPSEDELLAAAAKVKTSVADSLTKAMGGMSQRGLDVGAPTKLATWLLMTAAACNLMHRFIELPGIDLGKRILGKAKRHEAAAA